MLELVEKIRSEIQSRGPIPFHDFMQMALYCPIYGFYEKEADIIGRSGDFYTSVSVGPLFGQLLAYQFAEWLECPESKSPVQPEGTLNQIVEAGAHDGTLAKDILSWFQQYRPPLFERLEYWIVEPSELRRAHQEQTLARFTGHVRWLASLPSPDRTSSRITHQGSLSSPPSPLSLLPSPLISGLIFSNELLDAMPVHRIGWDAKSKSWFEWGVTWEDERFTWTRLPQPSAEIQDLLPKLPDALIEIMPDGFSTEIPAAALELWRHAANCLKEGRLMTIDYGFNSGEFLAPQRAQGTLRAYRRHRPAADVLSNPGEQDITAQVNFSLVAEVGESCGLITEPVRTQAQFLTGIFSKLSNSKDSFGPWTTEHVRQFQTLTHPDHLGRAFRALVQRREGVH